MDTHRRGIAAWKALLAFVWRFFSIGPLLKTLLSPFHRDTVPVTSASTLSLGERLVWNIFSRLIGFVIRIVIIVLGVLALLFVVVLLPLFAVVPITVNEHWLRTRRAVGRGLAYGYTSYLKRHSIDMARASEQPLIGKADALAQLERVLGREFQNNVLLVGEPGVGRTTLIEQFANRASWGETLPALQYRRVFQLVTDELSPAELRKLFVTAASAGNVVVVLDNLHTNEAVLNELLPFTEARELQIIGITDYTGYHEVLKHRRDIMQRFEKVEVAEPSAAETQALLKAMAAARTLAVTDETLTAIVTLSDQLIHRVPQPEKSIDIFEELLVTESKEITLEAVHELLAQKTGVPVGKLSETERDALLHLEDTLKQHIFGQDAAVEAVASTLQRARTGMGQAGKPIGSFLFLGPTGVGKTYTAKLLSRIYYQSDNAMVRFDMSEYAQAGSAERLMNELVVQIENNPFTLLLFDEVEKAHASVLDLFLQMLDEAHITNTRGEKAYFTNAFIICTSNAGSQLLLEQPDTTEVALIDQLVQRGTFRMEFLNRFNGIVAFRPLADQQATTVASQMLDAFAAHVSRERKLTLTFDNAVVTALANTATRSRFGARAIQRALDNTVASYVAEQILTADLGAGDVLHIPATVLTTSDEPIG